MITNSNRATKILNRAHTRRSAWKSEISRLTPGRSVYFHLLALAGLLVFGIGRSAAHIIPPEKLHPVAESYRRVNFILNLNPIVWDQVHPEVTALADYWRRLDPQSAEEFLGQAREIIVQATGQSDEPKRIAPLPRRQAAELLFQSMTRAITDICRNHMETAEQKIDDRQAAMDALRQAQGVWGAFELALEAADPAGYRALGECWLKMYGALGSAGLLGVGEVKADRKIFQEEAKEILDYLGMNFGANFTPLPGRELAPWPAKSPSFNPQATLPIKLPPGSNINKQIPRPRQILNMSARGVDESDTALIAVGDMAFDSAFIFGEPARSLGIACNTCHNKSITNPNLFIPGLSQRPGGMDVSNGYFALHANNGHFDPLDSPDLRGIRFTAPYGRNGRFASLREFVRNVIVNEFNGDEPDPMVLDGLVAYMNEFDFLSNPNLKKDGTLNDTVSETAKRGEKLFHKPFPQMMGGLSCASCHLPSANFLDHKRHDIGTVRGHEDYSRDRALDTPTLLGIKYSPPYFHDGSQATLRDVVFWFNNQFKLGLKHGEVDDMTAYLEMVGDGVDAYEDSIYYLDAEMEEFSFFLSAYEVLEGKNKSELINTTFQTIAQEIRNHEWELQDPSVRPVMHQLAKIMDQALAANRAGDRQKVRQLVADYRALCQEKAHVLK